MAQRYLINGKWVTKSKQEELREIVNTKGHGLKKGENPGAGNDKIHEEIVKRQIELDEAEFSNEVSAEEPKKEAVAEEPKPNSELEELQAECDARGIEYHHKAGVKKLQVLLNTQENDNDSNA